MPQRAPKTPPEKPKHKPKPAPLPPWGLTPEGAIAWQLHRDDGGTWSACWWFDEGTEHKAKHHAMGVLSVQTIAERWGRGNYRIHWMTADRRKGGVSAPFRIETGEQKPNYPNDPALTRRAPTPEAAPHVPDALLFFERIYQQVRVDADRHVALLQAESQRTMERERLSFEREIERTREFYAQLATIQATATQQQSAAAAAASSGNASTASRALLRRIDELEESLAESQEPQPSGGVLDSTIAALLNQYGPDLVKAIPKLVGMLNGGGAS